MEHRNLIAFVEEMDAAADRRNFLAAAIIKQPSHYIHHSDGREWFTENGYGYVPFLGYAINIATTLEETNFDSAMQSLEGQDAFEARIGGGIAGPVRCIAVNTSDKNALDTIADILYRMASYPVLDGDAMAEMEYEDARAEIEPDTIENGEIVKMGGDVWRETRDIIESELGRDITEAEGRQIMELFLEHAHWEHDGHAARWYSNMVIVDGENVAREPENVVAKLFIASLQD